MPVSQVIFQDSSLIDLTNDTVTPEDVREGVSFHGANGMQMMGTSSGGGGDVDGVGITLASNYLEVPVDRNSFKSTGLQYLNGLMISNLQDYQNIPFKYRQPYPANTIYILDENLNNSSMMFPLQCNIYFPNSTFGLSNNITDASYMFFGSMFSYGYWNFISENGTKYNNNIINYANFNRKNSNNHFTISNNLINCKSMFEYSQLYPDYSNLLILFEDNSKISDLSKMFKCCRTHYGSSYCFPYIKLQNTTSNLLNMSRMFEGIYNLYSGVVGIIIDDTTELDKNSNNSLISFSGRDNIDMSYMFANTMIIPSNIHITHNNINMYRMCYTNWNNTPSSNISMSSYYPEPNLAPGTLKRIPYRLNINIIGNDINCYEMFSNYSYSNNIRNDNHITTLYSFDLSITGHNINASRMFSGNMYVNVDGNMNVLINASGNFSDMTGDTDGIFYNGDKMISYQNWYYRNIENVRNNVYVKIYNNSNYYNMAYCWNISPIIINENNQFIHNNIDLSNSTRNMWRFENTIDTIKGDNINLSNSTFEFNYYPIYIEGNNIDLFHPYGGNFATRCIINGNDINISSYYEIYNLWITGNNIKLNNLSTYKQTTQNVVFNCNFTGLHRIFSCPNSYATNNIMYLFNNGNFYFSNCNYFQFIWGYGFNSTISYSLNFVGNNCLYDSFISDYWPVMTNCSIRNLNISGNNLNMYHFYNHPNYRNVKCNITNLNIIGNNIIMSEFLGNSTSDSNNYIPIKNLYVEGNNINLYNLINTASRSTIINTPDYFKIILNTRNSNYKSIIPTIYVANPTNIYFTDIDADFNGIFNHYYGMSSSFSIICNRPVAEKIINSKIFIYNDVTWTNKGTYYESNLNYRFTIHVNEDM